MTGLTTGRAEAKATAKAAQSPPVSARGAPTRVEKRHPMSLRETMRPSLASTRARGVVPSPLFGAWIVSVTATLAAMLVFWGVDVTRRVDVANIDLRAHALSSLALYVTAAVVLGTLAALVTAGVRLSVTRLARRVPVLERRARVFGAAMYGSIVAIAASGTHIWLFSGRMGLDGARRAALIAASLLVLWLAVTSSIWLVSYVERRLAGGARAAPIALAVVYLFFAAGLIYVDTTLLVGLYARAHAFLEASALFLIALVAGSLVHFARRTSAHLTLATAGVALAAAVFTGYLFASPSLRENVRTALRHARSDELYAGRMLNRFERWSFAVSQPGASRTHAELERLRERYDVRTLALGHKWQAKKRLPPPAHVWPKQRLPNVLVFYVDTLRQDTAADEALMPNVARFAKSALAFPRAYAAGSDTLRSLPALTGGRYEVRGSHAGDLLNLAERSGFDSRLVIGRSAREFLAKLRPEFRFPLTLEVADYEPSEKVWGYGARQPTADRIVDQALAVLAERPEKPFFLWLFHFDQHNWRELDRTHLYTEAARFGIADDADRAWPYRVVARSIDVEFGRLLDGLESLGLGDDTIVLFVSDHGEALGKHDFWIHSVVLWDSLLRVPLLLRIPGVEPGVVERYVSLVDVAPTLARLMDPRADLSGYDGEDLLEARVTRRRERPLLAMAASRDFETPHDELKFSDEAQLVRVGIVDPERELKLVLPLQSAVPELYRLADFDPDEIDVAAERFADTARLLSEVIASPIFPRGLFDSGSESVQRAILP